MRGLTLAAAAATLLASGAASAHCGHDHGAPPGWTWDAWITVPLLLAAALFAVGWFRLHARSGAGRPRLHSRARLFAGGWMTMAVALVSPLHEAGERSFTAHMVEHELLMLLGAPLLVLAEPLSVMLWGFPLARVARSAG